MMLLLPLIALSAFVGLSAGQLDCGLDTDGDLYFSHDGSLACLLQTGRVADCDDTKAAANPGSANAFCNCNAPPALTEICDGVDNTCDGVIDELLWLDADGDGFSAPGASITCVNVRPNATEHTRGTDCNDADATINPDAIEVPCDGIDQDCNQATDDVRLEDRDQDGEPAAYPAERAASCLNVATLDCDDNNARRSSRFSEDSFRGVQPDGTFGDGVDNNCDNIVDNGFANNVRLALSGHIINLENARKRTIFDVASSSSSSSESSDSSCTNLLVELTLTNSAVKTDATNVIVEGKLQLPRGSLIKSTVLGQLGRYGVKVDAKTGAITWVQFKLDKMLPGSLANSQTIQLPICSDNPNGNVNVKLQVVRMDQTNYDASPAKLELRQ